MFFSHLTLFRFAPSLRPSLEALEERLDHHRLTALGELDLATRGFVSPFGSDDQALSHRVGDAVLLTLGGEEKLLPSSVIGRAVQQKVKRIETEEGRLVGARERRRLKDEVVLDLLPRAFSKPSRCSAFLDLGEGWAVVDTSSRKAAEGVVSAIREALGSFPAVPVNAECSPRALLTAWLAGEPLPEGFALGDECELRDPIDAGAVVKCRRQDLDAEEVREHLKCGKQVFQLALVFNERLSFVLGEDLVIRKLKMLEVETEDTGQHHESHRAEVDATFALMAGELRVLLKQLEAIFSISTAESPLRGAAAAVSLEVPPPETFQLEHTSADPLYDRAIVLARRRPESAGLLSELQHELGISHRRAAQLLAALKESGLVQLRPALGVR